MSVVYDTTLKNTRMTAVVTALGTTGNIQIGTTGMATVLVTIPLANPAGTVSGGVLTFTTPENANATATGTAAAAIITDGTNTHVSGLTVGTSGTDIVLNSTSITSGQNVTITSATITHG